MESFSNSEKKPRVVAVSQTYLDAFKANRSVLVDDNLRRAHARLFEREKTIIVKFPNGLTATCSVEWDGDSVYLILES